MMSDVEKLRALIKRLRDYEETSGDDYVTESEALCEEAANALEAYAALEAATQPAVGDGWGATPSPCNESVDQWIERNFFGHGRAIRRQEEEPYPGEPYMSMDDARNLVRQAVKDFSASPAIPERPSTDEFVTPLDYAEALAFAEQLEQAGKRDKEPENSESWQVYNHGVFIAGKIRDAIKKAPVASPAPASKGET